MFGALLTDLSEVFDWLLHCFINAKLNACGFDMKTLNFIYDYLRNRKQKWIRSSSRINFGAFLI